MSRTACTILAIVATVYGQAEQLMRGSCSRPRALLAELAEDVLHMERQLTVLQNHLAGALEQSRSLQLELRRCESSTITSSPIAPGGFLLPPSMRSPRWTLRRSTSSEFKIGYLYAQKDSSWLVESFSQFRLAVKRINDHPPSASFPKLTYVAYDSGPRRYDVERTLTATVAACFLR
jgi:hypothetical protein